MPFLALALQAVTWLLRGTRSGARGAAGLLAAGREWIAVGLIVLVAVGGLWLGRQVVAAFSARAGLAVAEATIGALQERIDSNNAITAEVDALRASLAAERRRAEAAEAPVARGACWTPDFVEELNR